jgi:drug/metabolite transporter (DMT)-like permease
MRLAALTDHARGLVLTTIGGLALSVDIPLIRLSDGEVWSILGMRNIVTLAVGCVLLIILRFAKWTWKELLPGRIGIIVGLFYSVGSIGFIFAVYYTSAANVVFILAFNPVFAALLAWAFFRERPAISTMLTMAAMIFGVGLIVGGGIDSGHWFGDLLSALSALCTAFAITIGRHSKRGMGFMPLLATSIPAAIGLSHALPAHFSIAEPFWIILDGGVMMPLAFWCLATGPRYLSGAEVGMFYLLETILAPVWIWMIFSEVPSATTLLGGAIMIIALFSHSLWQVRSRSRSALPSN